MNIEAKKECLKLLKSFEEVGLQQTVLTIKGFPTLCEKDIEWLIKIVLGREIYFPTRKNISHVETFSVEPFLNLELENLSESSRTGGFHTDFWSAPIPPKYIFFQCLYPDPRHPYFGRNQYVKIIDFFEELKYVSEDFAASIAQTYFRYKNNLSVVVLPFFKDEVLRFHEHIVCEEINYKGFNINSLIRELSLSKCTDFALDKNEIVIINNHKGLHRRGEATIDFRENKNRCLRTARFN